MHDSDDESSSDFSSSVSPKIINHYNKKENKSKEDLHIQLIESSICLKQGFRQGKLRIRTDKGSEEISCDIQHIKFEAPELDVGLRNELEKALKLNLRCAPKTGQVNKR